MTKEERKVEQKKEETLESKTQDIFFEGFEDEIEKYLHIDDVKAALELQDDAFIELFGLINGLKLVNRFNPLEVNTLLAKYQDRLVEIFGDFDK
ncbi:MAG TPA: hypothetical protein DCL21_01020 [Alphaproteobacteria bacterium]|nr:hypothetical protein [Alphaproteobacteria bacterium]